MCMWLLDIVKLILIKLCHLNLSFLVDFYAYLSACTFSTDVPNTRCPFTIQFMIMSQNITSEFNQ